MFLTPSAYASAPAHGSPPRASASTASGPKTVGPDLRREVVDRYAKILPRHLLPHNRENPTDGNGLAGEARARDGSLRRDRLRVRTCLCGGGGRGRRALPPRQGACGSARRRDRRRRRRRRRPDPARKRSTSMFARPEASTSAPRLRASGPRRTLPVWELPLERWRATLDANLTATFLTARGFLRQLEGDGALILVGSTAGIVGEAGHADYAAAKSAILGGLLLSLKNEVVRKNPLARVNAVAPGWTESPMTRGHVSRGTGSAHLTHDGPTQGRAARGRRRPGRSPGLAGPVRPCHRPGGHGRRRHGRPRHPRS